MECFQTILTALMSEGAANEQPEPWKSSVETTKTLIESYSTFFAITDVVEPLRDEAARVESIFASNNELNNMIKEYNNLTEKNQREREEKIIHENDIKLADERIAALQSSVNPLREEIATRENELKSLETQTQELDSTIKKVISEHTAITKALDELTSDYTKLSLEEEQITKKLLKLKSTEAELQNDLLEFPSTGVDTRTFSSPLPEKTIRINEDIEDMEEEQEAAPKDFLSVLNSNKLTKKHNGMVTCMSFANTTSYLATGSEDSSVSIIDLTDKTNDNIRLKGIQHGTIMAAKFSPFDNLLCVASYDSTVKLYKAPKFSLSVNITENRECVSDVCFATDSRFITCCRDNTIKLYDINRSSSIQSITSSSIPYSISMFQGESTFVTAHHDGKIRLWDVRTNFPSIELNTHKSQIIQVIGTRNSSRIVSLSTDKSIAISDCRMKVVTGRINIQSSGLPSDKMQMTILDNSVFIGSNNGNIYSYNMQNCKVESNRRGHNAPVLCVAVNPRNKLFASGDKAGFVKIWNS